MMWTKGVVILLVLWEGLPGDCSRYYEERPTTTMQPHVEVQSKPSVTRDLLHQEVLQLSHLISAFLAQPRPEETVECRPLYEKVGGRCLRVVSEGSWSQARQACRDTGGELLKVDDANFMADVAQYFSAHNANNYWIGARDTVQEGTWLWTDGSPVRMGTPFWGDYADNMQEPSGGRREDCAIMAMEDHYFFHDEPCNNLHAAICE